MFKGFKDFLLRGNVIDLAVAVVIGAAFTGVVTAFTTAFLKPLIQLLSPGGGQFAGTIRVDGVVFDYASFINETITFLITAAVVYFLVVAPMKAIQARRLRGEESGPAQATDVELLAQIRDLLQAQVEGTTDGASSAADDAQLPLDRSPAAGVPVAAASVPDSVSTTAPVLPRTHAPAGSGPRRPRAHAAAADGLPVRPAAQARPTPSGPPRQFAGAQGGHAPEGAPRHGRPS